MSGYQEQNQQNMEISDDEVSLKELILKLQEFFFEILKYWKWVVGITALCVALFLYNAITEPVTYPAQLTFMINEDEGNPLRGLGGGVLGALMPKGKKNEFNLAKIIELSKSRSIMQRALFKKGVIEGNEDFIANHLIREYDFHDEWESDTTGQLKDFLFVHDSIPLFTDVDNRVVKVLHGLIIGDPINGIDPIFEATADEDSGIMKLSINTTSQALTIEFLNAAYDYLSHFYIERAIEKHSRTFRIMEAKADSIQGELRMAEKNLADFLDGNRRLVVVKGELDKIRLQRKAEVLNAMYIEIIKNLETADFALKTKVPYVQELDKPIPPLRAKEESKFKAIILGGFLGGFLSCGFIIGRKVLRDIME